MLVTETMLNVPSALTNRVMPFHTFLMKVASRCNINCTYCYIYNRADGRWARQPVYMSQKTASAAASRIAEHCRRHEKESAVVILHGGEPLMAGPDRINGYARAIAGAFHDTDVKLTVGMQSNALLFNSRYGDLMTEWGMTIGVSIDGPPEINDRYRVDHRGRPTSAQLEKKLDLLTSSYPQIFTGFLTVIDIEADPTEVVNYLLAFNPPTIDFLFPLDNHDRRPVGKDDFESTPYGNWLIAAYDTWIASGATTRIRIFQTLLGLIIGSKTLVETFGTDPVDLVVVESNGELESVDSLKAVFDGATELGFNIEDHNFDEVAEHVGVKARQAGVQGLCETCRNCDLVRVCGGGYYPHRYSEKKGFQNPSIYCRDIAKLIRHIQKSITASLGEGGHA